MKTCKICKIALEDEQKFCHVCGATAFEEVNHTVSENSLENSNVVPTPPAKSIASDKKMIITIVAVVVAVMVVVISVATAIILKSSNKASTTSTTKHNTASYSSTNTSKSDESKTEERKSETTEEQYDSVHWQKNPVNSNAYKNSIAYNYIMGAGTFIDKINSVSKQFGLSFKWAGDLDMGEYTRRIFTIGGFQNQNVEQEVGYYMDVIEDDDASCIVNVTAFVGRDYTYDSNQALATLIVMALYAYDEIPLGNQFSTVMDKILAGGASFRYNDFLIVFASNETINAKNIFKSTPSMIRELERETNVKLEDYSK